MKEETQCADIAEAQLSDLERWSTEKVQMEHREGKQLENIKPPKRT